MSVSSDLSQAVVIDRVAARLAFLAPSGQSQVFFDRAQNLNGLEAFAVISDSAPIGQEGFGLVISQSHRSYKPLGSVIEEFWLGMPLPKAIHDMGTRVCEMSGISAIVGSRIFAEWLCRECENIISKSRGSGAQFVIGVGEYWISSGKR